MTSIYGQRRSAFTLIELLVVIAILMLLVAMLIPSLNRAREIARRAMCLTQMKSLCLANNMYLQAWRCYSPSAWAPTYGIGGDLSKKYFWYQRQLLGQYFREDIPMYASVNGLRPPKGSAVRCPSQMASAAVFPAVPLTSSWIGYNGTMSYDYGKEAPGSTSRHPFWRGPKETEIKPPSAKFVLFMDSPTDGWLYCCRWAYARDPAVYPNTLMYGTWNTNANTFDPRHLGGCNYGFADGHAVWFGDPDRAYYTHQIMIVPTDTSG